MKTVSDLDNSEILMAVGMFCALIIIFGVTSFFVIKIGGFNLTGEVAIGIISAATNLTFIFFVLLQFINQNQTLEAQTELIKAQKAQYVPHLNYNIDFKSNDSLCEIALRNDGEGIARNIHAVAEFFHRDVPIYRYIVDYQVGLKPGESALTNDEGRLKIKPPKKDIEELRKVAETSSASEESVKFRMRLSYADIIENDEFVEEMSEFRTLKDSEYESAKKIKDVVDIDSDLGILEKLRQGFQDAYLESEISLINSILRNGETEKREIEDFYTRDNLSRNEFRSI